MYSPIESQQTLVKVQDVWVVREYKDGTIQRILKLSPKVKPQEIILD